MRHRVFRGPCRGVLRWLWDRPVRWLQRRKFGGSCGRVACRLRRGIFGRPQRGMAGRMRRWEGSEDEVVVAAAAPTIRVIELVARICFVHPSLLRRQRLHHQRGDQEEGEQQHDRSSSLPRFHVSLGGELGIPTHVNCAAVGQVGWSRILIGRVRNFDSLDLGASLGG